MIDQFFGDDISQDKNQEFKRCFQNWPFITSLLPQKVFITFCPPYKLDLVQTILSQVAHYNFNDMSHYYTVIKFVTRF